MSNKPINGSDSLKLELSLDEANLVLEALGQLPYIRVFTLIERIRDQAKPQVQASSAEVPPAVVPSNGAEA